MVTAQSHYLLFCDSRALASTGLLPGNDGYRQSAGPRTSHRWHFVLEQLDGSERLEAADDESDTNAERAALLSVVRGLEAIDCPSRVTLVTTSRYVSRGLRYGLSSWRDSNYHWERFGVQIPIRNADLWQRIDTALGFHGVTCRLIHSDSTKSAPPQHSVAPPSVKPMITVREHSFETPMSAFAQASAHETGRRGFGDRQQGIDGWWKLAASWIKWWKGRLQTGPALTGI